jgi:hypothetical protein
LLDRFGIFGVRVAIQFMEQGAAGSARQLADALRGNSGLDELRGLLESQFAGRRDLLKGRAALLALSSLARRHPVPGNDGIDGEVERIQASWPPTTRTALTRRSWRPPWTGGAAGRKTFFPVRTRSKRRWLSFRTCEGMAASFAATTGR